MNPASPSAPSDTTAPSGLSRGERVARWLFLAAVMASAGFVALRFQVSTDITHMLPSAEDQRLARLARQLADSDLSRTMILSVGHDDPTRARAAAMDLAEALEQDPEVEWLQRGPTAELSAAFYEVYFPHRLALLSPRPDAELPARLSEAGLAAAAMELRRQLLLPTAALVKRVAPSDPLLAFPAWVARLESMRPSGLTVVDEQFMDRTGTRAVLFLGTSHSALSYEHQRAFLGRLDDMLKVVRARAGPSLSLFRSGVHRHAVAARQRIEADVRRISLFSAAAIVLLFAIMFRSVSLLAIGMLPLIVGVLAGLVVTLATAGRVHGLTLTFGATLIGICLDYPVHLFNHHTLDAGSGVARVSLLRVWPGLLLGAVTTLTGFAGLALSSLPAVREVALFASFGVAAALLATRLLVTPLLPVLPRRVGAQQWAARIMSATLSALRGHRRALWALPAVALLVAGAGLPMVTWADDVKALTLQDAALAAEDRAVRDQVSVHESGRVVVVTGASMEAALRANDRVALRLDQARNDGLLGGFLSLHGYLWSSDLQRRNLAALAGSTRLPQRLGDALHEAGFRRDLLAPFARAVAEPGDPLTWPDLAASKLGGLVRPFRIQAGADVGLLTFVRDVADPASLAAAVADVPGAVFFDQRAFMRRTMADHRQGALLLVLFGLLAVVVVVALRYRDARRTAAATLPALLAGAFTVGLLALAHVPLNLLHLVSLVLVLSMGVDYGVFLVESLGHAHGAGATLLSVVIACLSTVLAFGLLAMSTNPALRAIGLTTGIGVLTSLALAPTVLVLARPSAVPAGHERGQSEAS